MKRLSVIVVLAVTATAFGRVPAFPGAQGFGTQTPGGRGGRVIEVTNLNDSGPGSLRAAIEADGKRIVVFRVGGTIGLKTPIIALSPYLTIAGQTAPGDGILIRDTNLRIRTHDVVVRYLRLRIGPNRAIPSNRQDGLAVENGGNEETCNVVVDHCSVSWAQDENVGISSVHDVTLQWCLIAECLRRGYHEKGDHSMAVILGDNPDRISTHHNLLMSCGSRNPRIQGGLHDVVNNAMYNFGGLWATFSRNPRVNFVGNYYKRGPNSMRSNPPVITADKPEDAGKIFVKGNITPYRTSNDQDEWLGMVRLNVADVRAERAFDTPPITATPAEVAWEQILAGAGATIPHRDAVDLRLIQEARTGKGQHIDRPDEVGGFPRIAGGDAPPDTDHDGMPDAWEKTHGLDPNDPADGPQDRDGDGYTNVEEYLNSRAPDPTPTTRPRPIPHDPAPRNGN
jgi:pectate lyase